MPRISLIMPTYQRPDFLRQALESVVRQTFRDFEVLVCDNGADAETEQVVTSFSDTRLHYVPREQNLGMLRSAMLGFAAAQSPLVMKFDDDDLLLPNALEDLVAPFAVRPDLGLSFGGVDLIDLSGQPLTGLTRSLDESSGRAAFPEGFIQPATAVVARGGVQLAGAALRADLVDWRAVPDCVATAYDFHLALRAVEEGRAAHFTRARVVEYRIHPGSDTTLRKGRQLQAACEVVEQAIAAGRHEETGSLSRRLSRDALALARVHAQEGRIRESRTRARQSLRLHPSGTAARLMALSYAPPRVATGLALARADRYRRGLAATEAPPRPTSPRST